MLRIFASWYDELSLVSCNVHLWLTIHVLSCNNWGYALCWKHIWNSICPCNTSCPSGVSKSRVLLLPALLWNISKVFPWPMPDMLQANHPSTVWYKPCAHRNLSCEAVWYKPTIPQSSIQWSCMIHTRYLHSLCLWNFQKVTSPIFTCHILVCSDPELKGKDAVGLFISYRLYTQIFFSWFFLAKSSELFINKSYGSETGSFTPIYINLEWSLN